MPANVETMFSVRETPWHGLGRIVMDAPASREALELAGLDWQVESRNIYSGTGAMIPGYRANVRNTDDAVLGVVSDRYRIVQNEEAFQFTDDLLGEGITYETAGSLQGGKKVWMLAKLPEKYIIAGDEAKQIIRTHCKTFGGTLDDAECMKLTGLARNTYYKYKRQIRAELMAEQDLPKGASIFYEPPKSF